MTWTAAAAVLRARLDDLGMNQSDFAMRLGVSKKHVSEVMNGLVSVTTEFALKCERVLGLPMSALTVPHMHEALDLARVKYPQGPSTFWCHRIRFPHRRPKPRRKAKTQAP